MINLNLDSIQVFNRSLGNNDLLLNCHWVRLKNEYSEDATCIFKKSGELIIHVDKRVNRAKWENVGNSSLLIENSTMSELLKLKFVNEQIIIAIENNEYVVFVNEYYYEKGMTSFESVNSYLGSLKMNAVSAAAAIKSKEQEWPAWLNYLVYIFFAALFVMGFALIGDFFSKK